MHRRFPVLWVVGVSLLVTACNLNAPPATVPPDVTPDVDTQPTPTSEPAVATSTPLIQPTATSMLPPTRTPQGFVPPLQVEVTATNQSPEFTFPATFPFSYDVSANAGQTIIVSFDVVINNPGHGRVFIVVRAPDGEDIGQLVVTETATDIFEVQAETGGTHQILAASENLRGNFSLSYSTR